MKQKTAVTRNNQTLQILFIVAVVVAAISQLVYTFQAMTQAPSGTETHYDWMLWSYLIPVLILIAVFMTRRDRRVSVRSVFETLLLTISVFVIFSSLSNFLYQITYFNNVVVGSLSQWLGAVYMATPIILSVVGLIVVISTLRRKNQW